MATKGTGVSVVVGLLLCVGIWIAVPYNNFAFNNSFVCDGYLPEIVLLCIAVLVLVINPILRRCSPACSLSHRNLALISSMLLFAAVLPGNGLMRFFPHSLVYDMEQINGTPVVAETIKNSKLPPILFPDKVGADLETPVSSQLVDELDEGKSIPWSAWIGPGVAWGVFIVAFWVLMIGLGLIIYPQWRDRERLPFPLFRVYHAMIEDPEKGKALPPVFRSRLFWIGCGAVFLMHFSNGLKIFTDGEFPAFPVSWNISYLFTDGVWRGAPGFLKHSRIYFLFVGLAYFMPTRFSFSIWSTVLFFGLFMMVSRQYFPTFQDGLLYDQGCGALIAISIGILWLGRHHYLGVMRSVFKRSTTEEARSNALGGRLFLSGFMVMLLWYLWAGAGIGWSLFMVVIAVLIMLIVARIVAETGITYVWIIPLTASKLIGLFPQKLLNVSTAFLKEAHYIFANRASAVSVAAMTALSLGLDKFATPKSRRSLAGVGIVVLLIGLLVAGAVHLHMGYTMATSLDGKNVPITGRGARMLSLGAVKDIAYGRAIQVSAREVKAILFGFALAIALLFLCARFPHWPLHPIGLIFVNSSIGLRLVISLFLGWLMKTMLVKYGGAKAYTNALPLFLGIIFGEVFASLVWTLVPLIQILFGADPTEVHRMVIFQYT